MFVVGSGYYVCGKCITLNTADFYYVCCLLHLWALLHWRALHGPTKGANTCVHGAQDADILPRLWIIFALDAGVHSLALVLGQKNCSYSREFLYPSLLIPHGQCTRCAELCGFLECTNKQQ